jgi:hypothetical protein
MKFLNEIDGANKLKQDSNNRLVTDAEKTTWNSKAEGDHNHSALYEPKNTNIQGHISNKLNPHNVSKAQVGLGNVDNTSDLAKPISTATQAALNEKVDNSRVLTDVPSGAKFTDTVTTVNGKTGAISKADIVALGIPSQDTVYTHPTTHPYSMITGTPTSLPADGGHALSATHLLGDDTRAVNSAPSVYMNGGARYAGRAGWQTEFKNRTAIDNPPLSGTYVYLQTYTPWSDPSGGYPIQVVYGNGTPCWRVGVSTSAWSAWQRLNDNGNASTVNGFTVGTNVPANAKFTDTNTTYSVISTAEIDAGVSTTSRTISGARVKHILDKTKPVVSKVKPTNGSPIWYEEL